MPRTSLTLFLSRRHRRGGFTLVEIMIVVLIIGVLLAIAIPNFVKAREQARAKACSESLKQIQTALQQYAMDNKLANGASVNNWTTSLIGATNYIRTQPQCPSGGSYTITTIDANPTCSASTNSYPHSTDGN